MAEFAVYVRSDLSEYGGRERVLCLLGNYLQREGHGFRIVGLMGGGGKENPVIEWFSAFRVSRFLIPKTPRPERLFWLFRMLRGKQIIPASEAILKDFEIGGVPDFCLVTTHFEVIPSLFEIKKKNYLNYKILFWDHGILPNLFYECTKLNPYRRPYKWMGWKLLLRGASYSLKKADFHLAISTGIKKLTQNLLPSADVRLVFNPVILNAKTLSKRPKHPIFYYVGRLDDYSKNISFLLKGFAKISKEDWHLKIIGTGPDEERLKSLAVKLGISEKIEWLGFHHNPWDQIGECTALLLTSRFEGFPLVLAEANGHGIPVISSDCKAGPEDIVIEGVNGYLFPEGDLNTFVELLLKVIRGELAFSSPEEVAKTAERFSLESFYERFKMALEL